MYKCTRFLYTLQVWILYTLQVWILSPFYYFMKHIYQVDKHARMGVGVVVRYPGSPKSPQVSPTERIVRGGERVAAFQLAGTYGRYQG